MDAVQPVVVTAVFEVRDREGNLIQTVTGTSALITEPDDTPKHEETS